MRFLSFLVLLFAIGITPASANECNLTLQPMQTAGCPAGAVGAASHNPDWDGATINPNSDARSAIDAFGYCRYVGSKDTKPLFIPFGNSDEWRAYLTNHPSSVYLIQCARGGAVSVPPNFGHDAASNMCTKTPTIQPVIAPYMPANIATDFVAPKITYECQSGDGTVFTEEVSATLTPHDSGYGPSDDIGWIVSKVLYGYDGICGPANGVASKLAPTAGLCSVGTPTPVIGTGPFQWVCNSGTGGGHNRTCGTDTPCQTYKISEGACHCQEGNCFRPIYWADTCGHTWMDRTTACESPEPTFKPLPPNDDDNPHMNENVIDEHAHNIGKSVTH